MFYTIYKVTNLLNENIYIGKHQTKDLNDGYMGSGKHLKRAISKYGIENFKKEILFVFDNEKEMNDKEAELVNDNFVLREDTYNICVGGQGGFSYINSKGLLTSEIRSEAAKQRWKNENYREKVIPLITKKLHSKKARLKAKEVIDNRYPDGIWYGKTHDKESKIKIGKANSKKQRGENNSQYGTKWITNGKEIKKIDAECKIPEGWVYGATIIKVPIINDIIGFCDECLEEKEIKMWYHKLVDSGFSIRKFVEKYNYPYSYQTFVKKCRKHIPNFKTEKGKKFK